MIVGMKTIVLTLVIVSPNAFGYPYILETDCDGLEKVYLGQKASLEWRQQHKDIQWPTTYETETKNAYEAWRRCVERPKDDQAQGENSDLDEVKLLTSIIKSYKQDLAELGRANRAYNRFTKGTGMHLSKAVGLPSAAGAGTGYLKAKFGIQVANEMLREARKHPRKAKYLSCTDDSTDPKCVAIDRAAEAILAEIDKEAEDRTFRYLDSQP